MQTATEQNQASPGAGVRYDPNNPYNVGVKGTGNFAGTTGTNQSLDKFGNVPTVLSTAPVKDFVMSAQQTIANQTQPPPAPATAPVPGTTPPPAPTTPPASAPQPSSTSDTSTQTAIGTTGIASTGNPDTDRAIQDQQNIIDQNRQELQDIKDKISQVQAGTYNDPVMASLLTTINQNFDAMVAKQEDINTRTLAGMTQIGIRSGTQIYAQAINMGNLNKVMNDGLAKIVDINTKRVAAIAKAQESIRTGDYNELYKAMSEVDKNIKDGRDAMQKLVVDANNARKEAEAAAKQAQTERIQNAKQATAEAKAHSYAVLSYIDSLGDAADPASVKKDVQDYAAANGLDPEQLLSQVDQLNMTRSKMYGGGDIGKYQFYKDQTTSLGGTPVSFGDWQKQQAADKLSNQKNLKQTPTYKELHPNSGKSTVQDDAKVMANALDPLKGKDGFLDPKDYEAAKTDWVKRGHSAASFDTYFKNYKTTNKPK